MNTMLAIVGPTASGKSSLAMQVAERMNGEIICVDSQTIRRGLDIGTAKPTKADQKKIRHHLLDIIDPYEPFSAAEFKRRAEAAIDEIKNRNRLPILVGGTGLYMDAILYNFDFNDKADKAKRAELESKTITELQQILTEQGIDLPENAQNPRHLIRAIETQGQKSTNTVMRDGVLVVGLDPKEELPGRIEQRVRSMFAEGLVDEVHDIMKHYGQPPTSWDAIGYGMIVRQVSKHENDASIKIVIDAIVKQHRQYAKRQRVWFRRNKNISWFEQPDDALQYIQKQL